MLAFFLRPRGRFLQILNPKTCSLELAGSDDLNGMSAPFTCLSLPVTSLLKNARNKDCDGVERKFLKVIPIAGLGFR